MGGLTAAEEETMGSVLRTLFILALLVNFTPLAHAQAPPDDGATVGVADVQAAVGVASPATAEGQPGAPAVSPGALPPSGVAPSVAEQLTVAVPSAPSLLAQLGQGVIPYVIQGLGVLILGLFGWALLVLQARWKVDLGVAQDSMLRTAARKGIGWLEELSASRLKLQMKPIESAAKLKMLTDALSKQFPKMAPEDLQRVIHEELAAMAGVGATGSRAIGSEPGMLSLAVPATTAG